MSDFFRAVLSGDIVGSTRADLEVLDQALAALEGAARDVANWHGDDLRFTRFRGDGWQVICKPEAALRVALILAASLIVTQPLRTRLAIGFGQVLRTGSGDLSDASGPAFSRAGAALDKMSRGHRLVMAREGADPLAPAVVALCDAIMQGWTAAQAEAALPMLAPTAPTQDALAVQLGIRQQSVSDRLNSAQLWAVQEALTAWGSQQAVSPVNFETGF